MRVAAVGLVLLLAGTGSASAAPVLELAGGVAGGGGFNARVVGSGPDAAYFNPALLPLADEAFDVTFFTLGEDLSITNAARPAGADIAPSIYGAWRGDGMGGVEPLDTHPLATSDIAARQGAGAGGGVQAYLALGMVKRLFDQKVVLGFFAVLPTGQLQGQNATYVDEREQYFSNSLHFELLGDRLALSTFSFAVGGKLSDLVSVGFGFSAGLETAVTTPVYVPDAADYGTVFLDSELSVDTHLAPHFGATFRPTSRFAFAATLHTPSKISVTGKNLLMVTNQAPVEQRFQFTHGYEPLTIAVAGAFDVIAEPGRHLTIAATGAWRTWSGYEDRHGETPLDAWNDTATVALGGRYRTRDLGVHLDATWVPSPVPAQTGRTNYVDNTRVGVTTGIEAQTVVRKTRLRAAFLLQGHRLLSRSVTKDPMAAHPVADEFPDDAVDPVVDPSAPLPEAQGLQTNNPGYPGWSSSGWVFGAGITVQVLF